MAGLTINEIKLIRERIIVTIKRHGELTKSGHRMDYTAFRPALLSDEVISSNPKLKNADYSVKNILAFFGGQKDLAITFTTDLPKHIADGTPKHWIQFALKRVIKSSEIMEAARKTIQEIKTRNGVAEDEEFHISSKELTAELSRTIPFFELYLKTNEMSLKDFLKDLGLNGSNKGSFSEDKETVDKGKKQYEKEQTESVAEYSAEEAVKRVRKEILSILEQQGTVSGGYRQMVLGILCNALADSSVAYQKARSSYHGPARSFLLDCFGDLLTIEYLDGKDWARVPLAAFGDKKEKAKVELPKEKTVPEVKPVPVVEPSPAEEPSVSVQESVSPAKEIKTTKTTKTAIKKKEAATELLIHELSDLSDEEMEQLLLVVRLAHETSENAAVKTTKKKTEYAANKNETSAVVAIAAKVGINAQAVLAKNETMNKITAHLTTGEIIEIIIEEIRLRKGVSGELPETEVDKKAGIEAKVIPQYTPEIMTDADYEGLDDWLPF